MASTRQAWRVRHQGGFDHSQKPESAINSMVTYAFRGNCIDQDAYNERPRASIASRLRTSIITNVVYRTAAFYSCLVVVLLLGLLDGVLGCTGANEAVKEGREIEGNPNRQFKLRMSGTNEIKIL